MKTLLSSLAAAFLAASAITASAQTAMVTASGTLHQFTPGSVFVVNETAGPVTYRYGETVTYVTTNGAVIPEADVRMRLKVGVPVTVHYTTVGDARVVNRVVLSDIARAGADDDDDDDN